MKAITYKGKHAELCKAIANGRKDEAMELIYSFFRSEENTDSYSISVLTMIRELLESGDSDELYRIRIRMRSNGDRVFINLAQFIHALDAGGYDEAAETLAGKCLSELQKLSRSMQDFADEEGLSQATEMAGRRIRESMRILKMYFESQGDTKAINKCDESCLEMTRIFLFSQPNIMSEDMMKAAQCAIRLRDQLKCDRLCREIIREYGSVVDEMMSAQEFNRENYETLIGVKYAYETIHASDPEHPYADRLEAISKLLQE